MVGRGRATFEAVLLQEQTLAKQIGDRKLTCVQKLITLN